MESTEFKPFAALPAVNVVEFKDSVLMRAEFDLCTRLMRLWFTLEPHISYDYPHVDETMWHNLHTADSPEAHYEEHLRDLYGDVHPLR